GVRNHETQSHGERSRASAVGARTASALRRTFCAGPFQWLPRGPQTSSSSLSHIPDDAYDLIGRDVRIESSDIEPGAVRPLRLDQKHLTVAALDANGTFAPGSLQQGSKLLPRLRQCG